MRQVLLRTALAAGILLSNLLAQTPPTGNANGSASGTVVDAVTERPLGGAAVMLRGPFGTSQADAKSTVADVNGRFVFNGLAPGRYMVRATHDGYVNQGPGAGGRRSLLTLSPGQAVDDFTVALTPGSVITGHVTGANAKPVVGASLQALKRTYRSGSPELYEASSSRTGKSGEFRIESLAPGKYYLRAIPSSSAPSKPGSNEFYVPTFYPGKRDLTQSVPLEVRPGEELAGMDMTLIAEHVFTVRGHVKEAVSKAATEDVDITLAEADLSGTPSPYHATTDNKGSFEILNVPPGHYVLTAEQRSESEGQGSKYGRRPVRVGDKTLDNVDVLIARGVEVSGHISVDAKSKGDLTQMTGILESAENSAEGFDEPEGVRVRPDGSFTFSDVAEGTYRLDFSPVPAGYYLKTRSGMGESIQVPQGQSVRGVDVVLSPGAARVDGTALNDGQPMPGAQVILIPTGARRGDVRYYKRGFTDRQGRFAIQSVVPGDYEIFAFESLGRTDFMDPDFMAEYGGRGEEVSPKEGDTLSVQVGVIATE